MSLRRKIRKCSKTRGVDEGEEKHNAYVYVRWRVKIMFKQDRELNHVAFSVFEIRTRLHRSDVGIDSCCKIRR